MSEEKHLLAAIMFTDIVGYTALMGEKESEALEILRINRNLQKKFISQYGGVWLKEMGDGILARFDSALNAILCAKEIQKKIREEASYKVRIGIHLGDVTVENGDVFGDGVNIASRLQSIADPGGIYISESVIRAIRARDEIKYILVGSVELKNVSYPVQVFAIQGEGISIPSHQKLKELATPQGKVKMSYRQISLIFAIIFIAMVGWLIREFIAQPEGPQIASLAVLPLSNLTGNPDQEYFVTGMHNALINELSKISSLRIISRQSTLQFQGSTLPMKDIAKQLRVDAIVEGSVLQSWNHVQIQVQLIKILPKESNILANTYDCELSDVLNIYREITKDITDKVYVQLTAGEKAKLQEKVKINPEAYEAYLKGMFHWYKLTPQDLDFSENYFKLSQKLDSGFALAYVGLAMIGIGRIQMGYVPWTETFPVSLKNLNKALELDSTLSEAYNTSAFINDQSWNFLKAELEYKKALYYNSNDATARAYYGHFLYRMKRPEEGQQEMAYALKLDPFNTLFKAMYGMGLSFNKRYKEAQELLEGILKTTPDSRIALTSLRTLYHLQKKFAEAFLIWKKCYSSDPEAIEALDKGYEEGGYSKALQRLAELLIERSKTEFVTPWQIGTIYARAGMKKEALEWLEKAYNAHDPNMPSIYVDPIFDYLRDERGFKSLYDKMNFPN